MRTSSFWDITTNWGFNPLPELADDLVIDVADEQTVTHRPATNTTDSLAIRGDRIGIGDAS
jgi:hypothetical protein